MVAIQAEKKRATTKERELQDKERLLHRASLESDTLRNQMKEEKLRQEEAQKRIRIASEEAVRQSIDEMGKAKEKMQT